MIEPGEMNEQKTRLTIAEALRQGATTLTDAAVANASRDARLFLGHILDCDEAYLLVHDDERLEPHVYEQFLSVIRRRSLGEPTQYIIGHQEFFGFDFEVTPDVLIPRPETEILVECALDLDLNKASRGFLEVGTGSGCIAISILKKREDISAVAIDLSVKALEVALRNAMSLGVLDRLELIQSDCFDGLEQNKKFRFSMIVSNPPYIRDDVVPSLQREVRDHEPHEALAGGPDGLNFVRRLVDEGADYLVSGGYLLFEFGFDQAAEVRQLVVASGRWTLVDMRKDLQGHSRVVILRLTH